MDKAFKNMDDRYKTIDSELNYTYDSSQWQAVDEMLNNSEMDTAFVNASNAGVVNSVPNFKDVDDAFLDDSFVEAINTVKSNYKPSFFADFKAKEATLFQDESFSTAATDSTSIYDKKYWGMAQQALEKEGLNFEYKTAYWKEAELLLNQKSRQAFFWKWGSVASLLLLISIMGLNYQNGINKDKVYTVRKQSININPLIENNLEQGDLVTSTHENMHNKIAQLLNDENIDKTRISKANNSEIIKENLLDKKDINKNSNNHSKKSTLKAVEGNVVTKNNLNNTTSDIAVVLNQNSNNNSNKDQSIDVELQKSLNEITLITIPLSLINTNDNFRMNVLSEPQDITKVPMMIGGTHFFGVKISKGLGNNFNANINTLSARNSFYFDYRYKSSTKFNRFMAGVDLGVYHMNLANYEFENKYTVHHLDGNIDNYWYKMTYKDLIYLSSNVNLFYNFTTKHKVKMAFGINKLITSKIDVAYKSAQKDVKTEMGNRWGINNGINNLDLSLGLGYEFKLHKQFTFVLDTKYGIMDQTNNDYLRSTIKNNDFSFQIGLKYNIFSISK